MDILYLHENILVNILLRLPADKIHKLRLVCRSWFNLIHSSYFVDRHLHQSNPSLLLVDLYPVGKSTSSLFVTDLVSNPDNGFNIRKFTAWNKEVYATCNGLVLFGDESDRRNIFVANPATEDVVKLPPPNLGTFAANRQKRDNTHSFMITYKTAAREYQVIHCTQRNMNDKCLWEILTLGGTTWKILSVCFVEWKWFKWKHQAAIIIKDVAHWMASDSLGSGQCILSFDMIKEKLEKISVPVDYAFLFCVTQLLQMGSSLCYVVAQNNVHSPMEMWILKNPSTSEWSKLSTIDTGLVGVYNVVVDDRVGDRAGESRYDGELGLYRYNFYIYDVQLKQRRLLELTSERYTMWNCLMPHHESLVSCKTKSRSEE